jgi:hypothetical protein
MKIIFHDNSLCLRGTTVALYDYAYFCKKMFGVDASIMYNNTHFANNDLAIQKFKNEFSIVKCYNNLTEMQEIIDEISADAFFMIKSGPWDGVISRTSKNWINAIGPTKKEQIYGDRFLMGSKWLSQISGGIDYVPYMVNLPDINTDLREQLNIPKDAIVFGRNGGHDSFNLDFAKKAVVDILEKRKDVFFLFQGTDVFYEHERIIYLPASADLEEKVKFINTTDALIHARDLGESFGQTCAEFSIRNKPVITWFNSPERNHIDILGDKGFYYRDYEELMKILSNFEPDNSKDWNCYREYLPGPVMERFEKLYMN